MGRLTKTEADILGEFASEAHRTKSGAHLFSPTTALRILQKCSRNKVAVLGFEGFQIKESRLVPDMDAIAHLSSPQLEDWDAYVSACNIRAEQIIKPWVGRKNFFLELDLMERQEAA